MSDDRHEDVRREDTRAAVAEWFEWYADPELRSWVEQHPDVQDLVDDAAELLRRLTVPL